MPDKKEADGSEDFIHIKAGPKADPNSVALWDRDPRHPHDGNDGDLGEVWINAGDQTPVQVYPNAAILEKIRLGILEVSDAPKGVDKETGTKEAAVTPTPAPANKP